MRSDFGRLGSLHSKLGKVLDVHAQVAMVAHELGHAVHMLCQSGTTLDPLARRARSFVVTASVI